MITRPFNRETFLPFLRNFIEDVSIQVERLDTEKCQYTDEAYRLGHDSSLDLEVYEIHHTSTNDARVGIAKDAFKLLFSESLSNRALVVFVPEGSKQWRLSLLQIEAEVNAKGRVEKTYSNPRRHSYLLGEGGSLNTPKKYLIDLGRIRERKDGNKNLSPWEDLQSRFSVEALTKEFYNKLYNWYLWAIDEETKVTFPNSVDTSEDDRDNIRIKIIRLITRLLFVWFIKQKGLVPDVLFDENELTKILANFDPQADKDGKYYNAILQNLFFATLNNEVSKRRFMSEPYHGVSDSYGVKTLFRDNKKASWFNITHEEVIQLFHNVPFMNCGLFECLDKYAKSDIGHEKDTFLDGFSSRDGRQDGNLKYRAFIPNRLFFAPEDTEVTVTIQEDGEIKRKSIEVMGLLKLLKLYNFTVQENTPAEVEVSLDPELLGRVFENLLAAYNPETKDQASDRKSTGSFYTPRPIVEYMVNESLIAYLKNKVPSVANDNWRELISYVNDDAKDLLSSDERIATLNALYECKILDPACGSGAFPMGMLQQMVHITRKLDSEFDPYQTKLRIINNCIYGSDIQPIAMLISKLRFFISLICEQDDKAVNFSDEENNFGINTLPNLETKFVAANSLLSADIHKYADDNWTLDPNLIKLKNELLKIRREHFSVRTQTTKLRKREEDRLKRQEIQDYILHSTTQPNAELVQMYEARIRHLTAERELYEGEKLVEEIVPTQANLFDETVSNHVVHKDVNKIQRNRIDAEIADLRKAIEKENNKRNSDQFVKAIQQIANWNPYNQLIHAPFFDADWMFGIKEGFDIVIGNPPYVVTSKNSLYSDYTWHTDLYKMFFEMCINHQLKKNGHLCFITPKFFLVNKDDLNMREFFITKTHICLLTACNPFEAVTENVITLMNMTDTPCEKIKTFKYDNKTSSFSSLPDVDVSFSLTNDYKEVIFGLTPIVMKLLAKIKGPHTLLKAISQSKRGAEVSREFMRANDSGLKSLIGGDMAKYSINWDGTYLPKTHKEYRRLADFFNKNLIYLRRVDSCLEATTSEVPYGFNKNVYGIDIDETKGYKRLFVLGWLNSKSMDFYYKKRFSMKKEEAFPEIQTYLYELLPLPDVTETQSKQMINLVRKALNGKEVDSQIDILVYLLYKLTFNEVRIIDPEIETIISEAEYNKRLAENA